MRSLHASIADLLRSAKLYQRWKALKNCLRKEGSQPVTNYNRLKLQAEDGKRRFIAGWKNFLEIYRPLADEWIIYDRSGDTPQPVEDVGLCGTSLRAAEYHGTFENAAQVA